MAKYCEKTRVQDTERAAIVKKTARIVGVSTRQVRRVMSGENENLIVERVFMEFVEAEAELENTLLKEVKNLIPFI